MVPVIIDEECEIPAGIDDLDSFRRWARSDAFPERGQFSYLGGVLWVNLSPEQLFVHNQLKTRFATVLISLIEDGKLGYFFAAGARFTNREADLSTEPDGVFVSYCAVRDQKVRLLEGEEDPDEIVGSPEMVLEVVVVCSPRTGPCAMRVSDGPEGPGDDP